MLPACIAVFCYLSIVDLCSHSLLWLASLTHVFSHFLLPKCIPHHSDFFLTSLEHFCLSEYPLTHTIQAKPDSLNCFLCFTFCVSPTYLPLGHILLCQGHLSHCVLVISSTVSHPSHLQCVSHISPIRSHACTQCMHRQHKNMDDGKSAQTEQRQNRISSLSLFVFLESYLPFPSLTRLLLALTTSPSLILPGTLDSFLTQNCP